MAQNIVLKIMQFVYFIVVDDGAILDVIFEQFMHHPPSGFEKIMLEQSLL